MLRRKQGSFHLSPLSPCRGATNNSNKEEVRCFLCAQLGFGSFLPRASSSRPLRLRLAVTLPQWRTRVYHGATLVQRFTAHCAAITGEAILLRCERVRDSLKRSLFLIQNMVPTVLANQIAEVHNDLRDVKFVVDPLEQEAGKSILEMLDSLMQLKNLNFRHYVQAASKLNLTSPKAVLIERRAINKLLDKITGTDPKKEQVLKFFLYLVKKYGKNIKPDTGERNENLQSESRSLSSSLSLASNAWIQYQSSMSGETTPPTEFCCPISTKLMCDPKWFSEGHDTCPKTQMKVENFAMIPNTCMRDLICNWCREHGFTISDFLPSKDSYSYLPEQLNGHSMSSLHNVSVPLIAGNSRNFVIDHNSSSVAFSDASYVSDSSHFSQLSWSADYQKYLSFHNFNQAMFLTFFCELSIKDLKSILHNDDDVSWAMISHGFVEAFLEFLRNDSSSYSMKAQQAGLHFFLNFLSNSRAKIPSMDEEAFHLITSFLSSELKTEALLVLHELIRHLSHRQSRQMASIVTPPVLAILASEDIEGLELPLKIICDLLSGADVKSQLISLGIISKLVPILAEGSFVECCLEILRNLCEVEEAMALITRTDRCLGSIAEYLDTGSPKERELAVIILLAICSRSVEDCSHVMKEGVIPALVDLSVNGIDEAKSCSFKLLNLLRDMRQSEINNSCSQEVAAPR
ncbi:hypothetical protein ZWY2020_015114 [Hordeum vulgare]|nr:hypothetical protein ZWY2020_015114 [Hordeum vulgare]